MLNTSESNKDTRVLYSNGVLFVELFVSSNAGVLHIHMGFVDLDKAFDTVHRDMVTGDGDATLDGSTRSGSEDG